MTTPRRLPPVLTILAFGLILYLPRLGVEILRNPLEVKYALAAREMLRGSPVLVPHLFGELYPDKPPLYFWATALLAHLTGGEVTAVIARLPAVAAALAGLLLVNQLGSALFGRRVGLLAATMLGTSNLFFWYARQGHPDQFLTAAVTLACLGLWRGIHSHAPVRDRWLLLAYGAMGLGVLSKGLLGLVLPLLAGAAYLVATGPLRQVPGRLGLGRGLLAFLVVVLAWYGPAVAQQGQAYVYETLVHQHLVRYTRTWAHAGPWYYYLGEFPVGFFPWVLFLPGALVLGWRAGRSRADDSSVEARPVALASTAAWPRRPILLPLGWFLMGFVFLSLSTAKRGTYLLPLYPAAALMVAWLWDQALAAGTRPRWLGVPLGLACAAAVVLALGLSVVPRRLIPGHMIDTLVPAAPWQLAGLAVVLVAGAVMVWVPWRAGRPALALGALTGLQAVLLLTVATVRAPEYEKKFPVRDFAARVRATVPDGEPILSLLDDYNFLVAFYLDRPLRPLSDPAALWAARSRTGPRYALVDEKDPGILGQTGVHALEETRFGPRRPRRIVLVRLDPPPG